MGNGAAVKSGARAARGENPGVYGRGRQHNADDVTLLLDKLASGYDMAVGARNNRSQASLQEYRQPHL